MTNGVLRGEIVQYLSRCPSLHDLSSSLHVERVRRRAVLIAIGVGWDGRRHILGVELANRESRSSWREFLSGLVERGLHGVEFVASDHHEGLRQAIMEVFPDAHWQRCYVHFLRNAKDYLPRKGDDDCLTELRWLYDRRDIEEARRSPTARSRRCTRPSRRRRSALTAQRPSNKREPS